jgi:hypothetical protein
MPFIDLRPHFIEDGAYRNPGLTARGRHAGGEVEPTVVDDGQLEYGPTDGGRRSDVGIGELSPFEPYPSINFRSHHLQFSGLS